MTDQRERILGCACELYLKDGLEGFSMRKLARSVGVTAPALYRHYESKEEVLVEVVRDAYRRLSGHLYRALEGRTPEERFVLAGRGYLDFALETPRLYDVLFASPDQLGSEGLPAEVTDQACAIGQFWNDRVRECMDAGILRRADPGDVSVTMWAHAHGLLTLYLRGMLRADESEVRELYGSSFRRLLTGLAEPEGIAALGRAAGREPDGETAGAEPRSAAAEQERTLERRAG